MAVASFPGMSHCHFAFCSQFKTGKSPGVVAMKEATTPGLIEGCGGPASQ